MTTRSATAMVGWWDGDACVPLHWSAYLPLSCRGLGAHTQETRAGRGQDDHNHVDPISRDSISTDYSTLFLSVKANPEVDESKEETNQQSGQHTAAMDWTLGRIPAGRWPVRTGNTADAGD